VAGHCRAGVGLEITTAKPDARVRRAHEEPAAQDGLEGTERGYVVRDRHLAHRSNDAQYRKYDLPTVGVTTSG
jgi:hypothetical protein